MRSGIAMAVAALACLPGCGAALYMVTPEPKKLVPAEYSHLAGHKLATIVVTLPATELEHPDLPADLARYVQDAIGRNIRRMSFVSQSTIQRYQQTHMFWADTPPEELGRKFEAQMVLHLTVSYYSVGQMYAPRGRLSCSCALYDLNQPRGQEKVWTKPDLSVEWPPKEEGKGIYVSAANTKKQLLGTFATKLTDCFRQHWEPAYE